ncbi:hypothetical protein K2X89_17020 [Myxococcota bacterium]|nr:hypothetical protein [Myxococcota bacterium]
MPVDARTTVRALLAAAGIRPPEAEVETMIQGYPALRAAADALYCDAIACHAPAFLPTDSPDAAGTADSVVGVAAVGAPR